MSKTPHIADGESKFFVINITPDFCEVEGQVVPFENARDLSPERTNYAQTVLSRGAPVLMVGSVVDGVDGDAGKGIFSGTSLGAGAVVMLEGSGSVLVEGRPVCRHGDLCGMNAS